MAPLVIAQDPDGTDSEEVKNIFHALINIHCFDVLKNMSQLKIGKLAGSCTQKNPHYSLSTKEDEGLEHGFVENFCQLFD